MKLMKLPWQSNIFSFGVLLVSLGLIFFIIQALDEVPEFSQLKIYKGKVTEAYSYSSGRMLVSILAINTDDGIKKVGVGKCVKAMKKMISGNEVLVYFEKLSPFQSYDGRVVWHIIMNGKVLCDYGQNVRIEREKFELEKYIAISFLIIGSIMVGVKLFRRKRKS